MAAAAMNASDSTSLGGVRMVSVAPGVELNVVESSGGDPPVLMIHGLASNARIWMGVAQRLEGRAWQAVDLRGHGESSQVDHGYDFATIGADLARLVDPARPAVVVGQSWGGNVAIEFAARHPELVAGVVCVDGGLLRLGADFATWEEAEETLRPPSFEAMTGAELAALLRARFDGWPESGILGQLANFREADDGTMRPRLRWENHRRILAAMWDEDPREAAARVSATTVVLAANGGWAGKQDRVAEVIDLLADGRAVWVEGDHDLHAQHPQLVAATIMELV